MYKFEPPRRKSFNGLTWTKEISLRVLTGRGVTLVRMAIPNNRIDKNNGVSFGKGVYSIFCY